MNPNRLTWKWEDQLHVPEYNISSPYQDGDILWKIHDNYIEPFGLYYYAHIVIVANIKYF